MRSSLPRRALSARCKFTFSALLLRRVVMEASANDCSRSTSASTASRWPAGRFASVAFHLFEMVQRQGVVEQSQAEAEAVLERHEGRAPN